MFNEQQPTDLTSNEYWVLPESERAKYRQMTFEYNSMLGWVERIRFGHNDVQLKTLYRLKKQDNG